ncbi:histidine phosphatase family protein [Mesobacillus foraminis]|uniref:histidine phosphatase family protein n=1 Tax=Mesobacillus foraminis TaxID=279826 RepID=UPI000EF479DC|nr:phosphoglycerate mutase family protein [Mesobacillus foraminis]
MQITLIRHLPTEWNKKTWLQGRQDIELAPLTQQDLKRIQENKKILVKKEPFDLILASSLKRTHQTASYYGFQPRTEALLDELDFGPFEGRPKEQLLKAYGETWIEKPKDLVLGESLTNLEQRIILFLTKYQHSSNLLIFGHGSWIRAIHSYFHFGHINSMNKVTVENNQCITLDFATVG